MIVLEMQESVDSTDLLKLRNNNIAKIKDNL